jgi:hypothetical protein
MRSRIIGVLAMIIGIAGIGISVYGAVVHPRIVERAIALIPGGVPGFDVARWEAHWRTWCVAIAAASACSLLGGAYIFRKRAEGYLYIVCATAGLATFPWVQNLVGGKLHLFERASIAETLVLLAITISAVVAFLMARRANT